MRTVVVSKVVGSALFFLALVVACGESTPREPEPDIAVATEALSDACSPACTGTQMCCVTSTGPTCVTRAVGNWFSGMSPARLRSNGCLEYPRYPNRPAPVPAPDQGVVHTVPDFSYAGYLGGGKSIPWAKVEAQVFAEDPGDDRTRIQAAIDAVGNLPPMGGIRGAVLIRRGTYDIDGTIVINRAGVVLRGEGQGSGGTILRSVTPGTDKLIHVDSANPMLLERSFANISGVVPVGSKEITVVAQIGFFSPGDTVLVRRTPNEAWITAIGMFGDRPEQDDEEDEDEWNSPAFVRDYERTVVAITGPGPFVKLTLDAPVVDAIETRFGGGQVVQVDVSGLALQHIGIERLRLDSLYFTSPTDGDHTVDGIVMESVRNSWIRQVTLLHFTQKAINLAGGSQYVTVEDVAVLDPISPISGGFRYPFSIRSGSGILFQRCYARNGRHNFVTHGWANGPNVWLDCAATLQHDDDGPHAWWATGLLFDNIETGRLHAPNALNIDTNHGWRGAQVMFWNSEVTDVCPDPAAECPAISSQAPPAAMNWAVGNKGPHVPGRYTSDPNGIRHSEGVFVNPRSLYLRQLQDRLGPGAIAEITTPDQITTPTQSGRMGNKLRAWEGEGDITPDPICSRGVSHSNGACCMASCGVVCGGNGCSDNAGGGFDGCCTGTINASGRSCLEYGPPCILPTADPKCKTGNPQEQGGFSICCPPNAPNCLSQTTGRACKDRMPPCKLNDHTCTTGIPSTTSERACCPLICGRCGGQSCASLPDNDPNGNECCKGWVQAQNRSCANHPPPCVMPL